MVGTDVIINNKLFLNHEFILIKSQFLFASFVLMGYLSRLELGVKIYKYFEKQNVYPSRSICDWSLLSFLFVMNVRM